MSLFIPFRVRTGVPSFPSVDVLERWHICTSSSARTGSFYVGSTVNIERRLWQHDVGEGAEYTRRRRPLELVYVEEFARIDEAFAREKQVQGVESRETESPHRVPRRGSPCPQQEGLHGRRVISMRRAAPRHSVTGTTPGGLVDGGATVSKHATVTLFHVKRVISIRRASRGTPSAGGEPALRWLVGRHLPYRNRTSRLMFHVKPGDLDTPRLARRTITGRTEPPSVVE